MDLCEIPTCADRLVARHPWEVSRREFAAHFVRIVHRSTSGGLRRLLDLGCGDAFISRYLAAMLPETRIDAVDTAFGTDSYQRFAELSEFPNLHLADSIDMLDAAEGRVGLMLVMDVLEHVEDDVGLLRSLVDHPVMRSDAHALLTVPAMQFLYCSHDRLLGHYRRYSFRRLRSLAVSAGLEPLEGGYCYLSGFWIRAWRTIREKCGFAAPLEQTEVSVWTGNETSHRLSLSLLNADLAVSRWLAKRRLRIPGLSCYLLCRRPGL